MGHPLRAPCLVVAVLFEEKIPIINQPFRIKTAEIPSSNRQRKTANGLFMRGKHEQKQFIISLKSGITIDAIRLFVDKISELIMAMQGNPCNVKFSDLCKVCEYCFGKTRGHELPNL
jgi:hypothetical protein